MTTPGDFLEERRKADEPFRQSEARYRALFETTLDGIMIVDEKGVYIDVNESMCQMLKAPRSRLIGTYFADFIPPDMLGAAQAAFDDLKTKGSYSGEFSLRAADGSLVDLEWTSRAHFVPGLHFCVARDISHRKQAEEKLKTESAFRRAIEESIPAGIVGIDLQGKLTYVNAAFCGMMGWSEAELIGLTPPFPYWPPEEREKIGEAFAITGRGEAPAGGFELTYQRRNGERFNAQVLGVSLKDGRGKVIGRMASISDITQRRRAEGELREETKTLETIHRISATLSAELDLEKLVQNLTDAATELTGAEFGALFYNVLSEQGESYTLYTLSGAPRAAFAQFPLPRNTAVFEPTFRGEGIVRSDDITKDSRYGKNPPYHGKPPGHLPVVSYLAVPVISRSGEVLGGLFFGHSESGVFTERHEKIISGIAAQAAISIDNARLYSKAQTEIAERKRVEKELHQKRREAEESSRLKSRFVSQVSHDLRTPLNVIIGYNHLLLAEIYGPIIEEQRLPLEGIKNNADRLLKLIEDVLDLSKIESGKIAPELAEIDLILLIEELLSEMRPLSNARGLSMECRPEVGSSILIESDAVKLRQIFANLLSNAIKFTETGRIIVTAKERPERKGVEILIQDTGIGIRQDELVRIFESFYQVEEVSEKTPRGSGLGLAIVKELVELLHGEVSVESQFGKGSSFTVFLPRRFLPGRRFTDPV